MRFKKGGLLTKKGENFRLITTQDDTPQNTRRDWDCIIELYVDRLQCSNDTAD